MTQAEARARRLVAALGNVLEPGTVRLAAQVDPAGYAEDVSEPEGLGPKSWPRWAREAAEERAAILEHDAGLSRADAERAAVAEVRELRKR